MNRSALLLSAVLLVSGCTTLPGSGPDGRAIESSAVTTLNDVSENDVLGYALLDITPAIIGHFKQTLPTTFSSKFKRGSSPAPSAPLGVGDVVRVTLFESSSGGLFIPAEAGARNGNFVTLPDQTIGGDGTISVPYAGKVRAAGFSARSIEDAIVKALVNRAIEPQVIVSVVTNNSGRASVLGDVNSPNRLEINVEGERLLDVIARAGGINAPGEETYVTLKSKKRGLSGKVLFDTIVKDSSQNVYVYPDDTIYVDRERRTYVAIGATGTNGRVDFEETDLTLAEAVASVGGLLDARSNPKQVFLYRKVARKKLASLGVDLSDIDENVKYVPTVFKANFRNPSSLFLAQEFAMQDKDVLYASNADSVELVKFLSVLNAITSTAAGTTGDVVNVRTNVRTLGN